MHEIERISHAWENSVLKTERTLVAIRWECTINGFEWHPKDLDFVMR